MDTMRKVEYVDNAIHNAVYVATQLCALHALLTIIKILI